jgi:ABC-2 type transport system ATP-binding protein
MTEILLRLENVSKIYGDRPPVGVFDLNLALNRGEIYGLLGPNGAGKSTVLKLISYSLQPDRGAITFGDRPLSRQNRLHIGVAPQENWLYPHLNPRQNLEFFGRLYGLGGRKLKERVQECLTAVQLQSHRQTAVEKLSGGQQRRLNTALALIHRPHLLIVDEPSTGLDPQSRQSLWRLLQDLRQEGLTILLTTHLLEEAEFLCDRLGILQGGRLLIEGNLSQLQTLIPAQEILCLKTADPELAMTLAQKWGWYCRRYQQEILLGLPTSLEWSELMTRLAGLNIESLSRQPVKLEHIYWEVTQGF